MFDLDPQKLLDAAHAFCNCMTNADWDWIGPDPGVYKEDAEAGIYAFIDWVISGGYITSWDGDETREIGGVEWDDKEVE